MQKTKKILSMMLAIAMVFSIMTVAAPTSYAVSISDYIYQDAAGYVYADFPDEYPEELLEIESEATIWKKINALLDSSNGGLTLDEKLDMLSADGVMGADTSAQQEERSFGTGIWYGCARVGIPVVRMYDGPMGVRGNTGYETTRPSNEVSVASSFDTDVAYEAGILYGKDGKGQSGNMQLGTQNDIIRTMTTSRQRDMFGEDWYLSGTITAAMSLGLQEENVITCLKHFGNIGNVDEQTLHEMYLSSTEIAVKEGSKAMSVMTAYGTVNGVQDCTDSYLLLNVLRGMYNYKGMVITDWGGNYYFTTDDGVTMETPNDGENNVETLKEALANGIITEDYVDEMVSYNLYSLAQAGYLGLVYVGRNGVAVDENPPTIIELPDVLRGEDRTALIAEQNERAIELAEKGAVLLKNDDDTLPLADTEDANVALIGMGSTYLVAGHMHECSFGALVGLSVSPYDALSEQMANATVTNYVVDDIAGAAIPAEYLYLDAEATENGVAMVGTNGYGEEVDTVVDDIDFVTNSTNYKNAEDGTAFEYGDQGHNYTWTTYLKAPETGTYTIMAQGIAAQTFNATITIAEEEVDMGAAAGSVSVGTFATTGTVATETGMDIPSNGLYTPSDDDDSSSGGGGCGWGGSSSYNQFNLEEGVTYKITVTADGAYTDAYDYQRGVKDMQVRLAWVTPSQETANYDDAIAAAGTPGTDVVLFAHEVDGGNDLSSSQRALLDDAIAAAKEAGNSVTLVLSTAVAVDITKYADDVDAILEMWLPGQGGGTAIANILTGKYNPSGKLSIAWPTNDENDQRQINTSGRGLGYTATNTSGMAGMGAVSTNLTEGIYVGYKWYDAADLQDEVLYDFGYGLSYTEFDYEVVDVTPAATGVDTYGYDITVKVTNTGSVAGSDAPQVYIAAAEELEGAVYSPYDVAESWTYTYNTNPDNADDPAYADYFPVIEGIQQAKYQLVGYDHTDIIQPGESEEVTIHVNQRALSYWDVSIAEEDMYVRADGTKDKYTVIESARDLIVAKSSDEADFVKTITVDVEPAVKTTAADLVIGNVKAQPDEEVTINVEVKNNTGIAGYMLYIECDTEYVTITDVQEGNMTFGGNFTTLETENGYKVLWSNDVNNTNNGTLLTVTAKVAADAPNGTYAVNASYSDVNTADENGKLISLDITNGSIIVKKIIPGDINEDGIVTNVDIIKLARYLVNLETLTEDQKTAADFNGDGAITNADLVAMSRYVISAY